MGPDIVIVLDAVLLCVMLGVFSLLGLAARRRLLQRRGGTFDCSLRMRPRPRGKGWMLGVCRYTGDALEWYRVFSYSPRPRLTVARGRLMVVRRRPAVGAEVFSLLNGALVVECLAGGRRLEFGMTDAALTGLLSWLESAPPGQRIDVA